MTSIIKTQLTKLIWYLNSMIWLIKQRSLYNHLNHSLKKNVNLNKKMKNKKDQMTVLKRNRKKLLKKFYIQILLKIQVKLQVFLIKNQYKNKINQQAALSLNLIGSKPSISREKYKEDIPKLEMNMQSREQK